MKNAKCNVCKQDLFSDAKAKRYCKLCGMATEQEEFCCADCETKFKSYTNG